MESNTAEILQTTERVPSPGTSTINVPDLQHHLAELAQNPHYRFRKLYHWLWRKECILAALTNVLDNKGANTPGIDGVTVQDLNTAETRAEFVETLHQELKAHTYQPQPVRRAEIPKPGKPNEKRKLGIPTLKDRVVQALVKLVLEPIYESTFLDCSYGFRPGRSTMDAIQQVYRHSANWTQRQLWYIEGDLKACFDTIPHHRLLEALRQRILDEDVLNLITQQLKAGVIDLTGAWSITEMGTPQGGVASPLLANVFLHYALDEWWWQHYGSLSKQEKRKRRRAGQGNPVLTRYADDFLISTNGPKAEALALKMELQTHLAEWGLTLSVDKTLITHLNEGLNFLGFHARRYRKRRGGIVLITPTHTNRTRYKERVRTILDRRRYDQSEMTTLMALNRVTWGWGNYYRYVNATRVFAQLDSFLYRRTKLWLTSRHKHMGTRDFYRRFTTGTTRQVRVQIADKTIELFRFSQITVERYPRGWKRIPNPFRDVPSALPPTEPTDYAIDQQGPALSPWNGQEKRPGQYDQKLRQEAKDQHRCTRCGKPGAETVLEYHHDPTWKDSPRHRGITLCAECHAQVTAQQRTMKTRLAQNDRTSESRMR